jgi:hypothetical protein
LEAAVPDNRADGHAASGHSAVRRDRFARRANWLQLAWSSRLSVPRNRLLRKSEIAKPFNVDSTVNPSAEKYFDSVFRKYMIVFATSRLGKRGVVANRHQTWVRDAMDATVSRVRFRARANDANADAKSCGPDTPTLVSSALDDDLVRDGSKKARFPERARYKR